MERLAVTPLVTIGIPSYNRPGMLRRAIESALQQDYPNLEVVVSDDASTDAGVRLVLEEFDADRRFRHVCYKTNVGLVGNWQQCLAMAKGDLWLSLPNDDWLEPHAISRMAREFVDSEVGLAICGRFEHGEKGISIIEVPATGVVSGREFINHRLQGKCGFPPTELYRMDLVRDCGGYHDIGYAMDLMLELDVGSRARVAYVNEPLTHHNNHAETASLAHPEKAMTTLVALAKLAPDRYGNDIASAVRYYCIRGLFGRTLEGALNRNKTQSEIGCRGLKELGAGWRVRFISGLLAIGCIQFALHSIRKLKRRACKCA